MSFFLHHGTHLNRPSRSLSAPAATGRVRAIRSRTRSPAKNTRRRLFCLTASSGRKMRRGSFNVKAESLDSSFEDTNWIYYQFDWANDQEFVTASGVDKMRLMRYSRLANQFSRVTASQRFKPSPTINCSCGPAPTKPILTTRWLGPSQPLPVSVTTSRKPTLSI